MVILTLLAWATQTLLAQWGFGQATQPGAQAAQPTAAIIEIRCEATIDGTDVTLKTLCRWNDDPALAQHAEMVVWRLSAVAPVRQIGMKEIRTALSEAGVNLSKVQFSGAASCAVRRSEVDDATFARLLTRDAEAEPAVESVETAHAPAPQPSAEPVETAEAPAPPPVIEQATAPAPAPVVKVTIAATRPALRQQLVLTRALSANQKVLPRDLIAQVLIDSGDEVQPPTDPNAIIGQLLAKNMRAGEVITAACVKPEPLVAKDQFVTVTMPHEGATIETVARAMETGAKGEVIKARNEATGEIYQMTVTARAAGELQTSRDIASTE